MRGYTTIQVHKSVTRALRTVRNQRNKSLTLGEMVGILVWDECVRLSKANQTRKAKG